MKLSILAKKLNLDKSKSKKLKKIIDSISPQEIKKELKKKNGSIINIIKRKL